jgi:hypothetical protein
MWRLTSSGRRNAARRRHRAATHTRPVGDAPGGHAQRVGSRAAADGPWQQLTECLYREDSRGVAAGRTPRRDDGCSPRPRVARVISVNRALRRGRRQRADGHCDVERRAQKVASSCPMRSSCG